METNPVTNPVYTVFIQLSLNQNSSSFLRVCIEEGVQILVDKMTVSDLVTLNAEKFLVTIKKMISTHSNPEFNLKSKSFY